MHREAISQNRIAESVCLCVAALNNVAHHPAVGSMTAYADCHDSKTDRYGRPCRDINNQQIPAIDVPERHSHILRNGWVRATILVG